MRGPAVVALVLALGLGGAAAQTRPQSPPLPGGKQQREQPIEINADSLEVQQDKQVAIFTGNVDAVQGDVRLKADQLKVWYRQEKGEKPAAAAGAATPAGAIVRIDAIGRVFVSSPTQTAQGDVGVYDVDSRVITLTGKVVVTQEQNVVRGDRLVMDLNSGQAKMDGQGRVHGLFTPSKQGGKP